MERKLLTLRGLSPLPAHGPVFKIQSRPRQSVQKPAERRLQWPEWLRQVLQQEAQESWLPGYLQILLHRPERFKRLGA